MRRKEGEVSDIFITMDSKPVDDEEKDSFIVQPTQLS